MDSARSEFNYIKQILLFADMLIDDYKTRRANGEHPRDREFLWILLANIQGTLSTWDAFVTGRTWMPGKKVTKGFQTYDTPDIPIKDLTDEEKHVCNRIHSMWHQMNEWFIEQHQWKST